MKIVIVDDEKDIGYILSLELEFLGHKTVTFGSAQEAVPYFQSETCDAIICDFQMPKMNGLDLFSWLKTEKKNIPFYILTGEPAMDTQELLRLGITDVLFKPQDLMRLDAIFK